MANNKHNKGPMQVTEKAKDLKKSIKRFILWGWIIWMKNY